MATHRGTRPHSTWLTVPVKDELHTEVRAQAVRQQKAWPTVIEEAMQLWLAAQVRS